MSPIILFLACSYLTTVSGVCEVNIGYNKNGDLKQPQPLILTKDTEEFFYPNSQKQRTLELKIGESIFLACPGAGNRITLTNVQEARAICKDKKNFEINGNLRFFPNITCEKDPTISTQILPKKCLGKYTSIAIGFKFEQKFLTTIEVCRNSQTYETYYTNFKLSSRNGHYQSGYPRARWQAENYFDGMNLQQLYSWENQVTAIGRILKSERIAKQLVNKTMYLSRGHLTAKGDFIYGNQQDSTFFYLNAEPQWTTFNAKNWAALESSVRNFSAKESLDLEVYTGVHEQMTMVDETGHSKAITLDYQNSKPLLVPRFFWKIIYDPRSKKGTAFVGLNDPFITKVTPDVYLCKNRIESKINWLSWSPQLSAGVLYACSVSDLRQKISTIPPLKVIDILI